MESIKIVLIDGISSIIKEENFIKDEIPRYFSNLLEQKFIFWLYVYDSNYDNLNYECIPFWLKSNIIKIDNEILKSVNSLNISKESFILTSDLPRSSEINQKLRHKFKTININEIFKTEQLNNIADILLCFGFDKMDFFKFCKDYNFLGLDGNEYINLNSKKISSFAYCIKSDVISQEYIRTMEKFKELTDNKKIISKNNGYVLGITNKGKGLKNIDLNIINGKTLPLILF